MIAVTHCSGIKTDNDYYYLDSIRAWLSIADGQASFSFDKNDSEVIVHIKPSNPDRKQDIINNLLAINRMLGVKIIFSKSLKISKTISYTVNL